MNFLQAEALKTLMEETFKPLFHRYENFLGDKTYFAGDQVIHVHIKVLHDIKR